MDGARFDRLARMIATRVSRRGAVALAGALALGASRVRAANPATQLTPPTCGASGDVCTMLMGCCDGLTCVTSAINTNYGVCVAGEGGTVSIGTTLISPFSENVEQEVAAIAASQTSSTTTTTTDPQLEREQRLAEIKARKDARRSKQKTRRTSQKTTQQSRRDDRQDARDLRRGPVLRLELFNPGAAGDPIETVRVANRDDETVYLTRIESLQDPNDGTSFENPIALGIGETFRFISDNSQDAVAGQFGWIQPPICKDRAADNGFVLVSSFSSDTRNYESAIRCDGARVSNDNSRGKKRRRKQNSGKNRN